VVNAQGNRAYYSSARPGGMGGKDLYYFELPATIRPKPVTYLKGIISSESDGKPLQAQVAVIDLNTGTQSAATISDKVNGEFLVCIPSGSSYALNVSAAGHLFYSGNYTLGPELGPEDRFEANIRLSPIVAGKPIVLKNIFFESGSSTLLPTSMAELDKLREFLEKNPTTNIEIAGHTDNVGSDVDNLKLSQARAQSVVDFLSARGIAPARLTAKGYGESKPLADNATPEGRTLNRRTEFSILTP
jgi:outer membrane protein OmpA-like peptidoglycan-associated protein